MNSPADTQAKSARSRLRNKPARFERAFHTSLEFQFEVPGFPLRTILSVPLPPSSIASIILPVIEF